MITVKYSTFYTYNNKPKNININEYQQMKCEQLKWSMIILWKYTLAMI